MLSVADAMMLPSASEGLANAWVEALACGTRIVIADTGVAREYRRYLAAGGWKLSGAIRLPAPDIPVLARCRANISSRSSTIRSRT